MKRTTMFALLLATAAPAAAPAVAQYPGAPATPPAGQPAIDPYTARPGVTSRDQYLYDPVTGLPTRPRTPPGQRPTNTAATPPPPPPNTDPFAQPQSIPGLPSRTGPTATPPSLDPFSAQPGVQQMRTGTYDPYATTPGAAQPPRPGTYGTTQPGYPGQPRPYGTPPYGTPPTPGALPGVSGPPGAGNGYPGSNYGSSVPSSDPYGSKQDDKYSFGVRR